jgi:hypothetical protein
MAMTPKEMIGFFEQQGTLFSKGVGGAAESRNYHLAALNLGQVFKASVMQGLIGWRCRSASPVKPFKDAVHQIDDGMKLLKTLAEADCTKDVPSEKAGLVSFLVDVPSPSFTITELTSDRLLDAVLSNGLRGTWNNSAWNTGLEQLRKNKRAALAVESYSTYNQLLHADKAESAGLVELATKLFEKRAKDGFFSGGDQTEGGGPDNATTVDYRLAAVMKKVGHADENLHRWQWS